MRPRKKVKANNGKAANGKAAASAATGNTAAQTRSATGPAPAVGSKRKQLTASKAAPAPAAKVTRSAKTQKATKTTPAPKATPAPKTPPAAKVSPGPKAAGPVKGPAEPKAAAKGKLGSKKAAGAEAQKTKKRNTARPIYDEIWKEVYLAGTEWEQMKMVYDVDWDFDHLDDALMGGNLEDRSVYLFGSTEPQLIMRDEKDVKGEIIPVPVIIAVVIDVPPPATVGIKSVQRAKEEIIPMADIRMGWHAHIPPNLSLSRRFKPKVHVLKCNERRARLRNMVEAAVHKYDYVLPYFIKPDQVDDATEDTIVQVLADLEGFKAPLMCEFDYEMDDFKEFVAEKLEENELDAEKHAEPLKTAIREAVKATKRKYKAEREGRQKRIDAISSDEREAIKNMKLLKFYPMNDWPDVSKVKSPYINRYYGRATEVL